MKFDMSDMIKKMAGHEDKLQKAIVLYGETAGLKLEAQAKEEAPWTDRTGNARNSIKGGADPTKNGATIFLSGNMSYSKYLEVMQDGAYAILEDTVNDNAKDILKGLDKILDK